MKHEYDTNREFMMPTTLKTLFEANIDASTKFERLQVNKVGDLIEPVVIALMFSCYWLMNPDSF